ncbi:MAG: DUF1772 domain-containing protein [Candidatus Abyssobacteria bacterium SURF_5]|uniref:DUF1772 domain-containing protein n=1 Tax=Abyssobacteria bacterium (strain SURF_5) TaxID=2093360 RepID=A0A3A4NUN4_ABYX5|nr:MAG: DUF1772 domain-containing protein [Candidatus Abyssubacteria bacterium SURF_5]
MRLKIVRFLALLFTAIALAASLAHLFELPNKIELSREAYLTVQQIYRGWALLGFVVAGALISTLALTFMVRRKPKTFALSLAAFLCIAGTQVIFWTFTYPANRQTNNWTMLPANWEHLRAQWEYSHAAGAVLNLSAFISLVLSVLTDADK